MTKVEFSETYGSVLAESRVADIVSWPREKPVLGGKRKEPALPVRTVPHSPATARAEARTFKSPIPRILRSFAGRTARAAWGWPFPLTIFALWWLASARGWVPEQILPPPPLVYRNLADLFSSGDLAMHLKVSSVRLAWGFLAGSGIGFPLGLAMGMWSPARDYLLPGFKVVAQVPILGWIPLLMMLVGIDEALKIIIIAKAVCLPIALNTCKGMQDVPSALIEVAKVYRFTRAQMIRKVVLRAAFPQIWAGVRYGLTHGWLALVVVELLASSEGLGFLIVYGRQLFQLDTVLAAVIVVGSIGWSLDKLLSISEERLLRWRRAAF